MPELTCGRCIVHLQQAIKHDFVAETLQNLITFYERVFLSFPTYATIFCTNIEKARGASVRIEDSVEKLNFEHNHKNNQTTVRIVDKRQVIFRQATYKLNLFTTAPRFVFQDFISSFAHFAPLSDAECRAVFLKN